MQHSSSYLRMFARARLSVVCCLKSPTFYCIMHSFINSAMHLLIRSFIHSVSQSLQRFIWRLFRGGLIKSDPVPAQPRLQRLAKLIEGMIESRSGTDRVISQVYTSGMREPMGDCSRLRVQAPRKHDFVWRRCGQRILKETLLSQAKEVSAQSTVYVSA